MPLQLLSKVTEAGQVELSLSETGLPELKKDEVLVRIEAAPINPSDLGLLLGPSDVKTARSVAGGVTIDIPESARTGVKMRLGQALPVGNEGAGVVVKAGASPAAQAMLGKVVGVIGGATYSEYVAFHVGQCVVYPAGVTPREGASWFVNPLTALSFLETMRAEGHTALIHTAAASNLGQMLAKVCLQDGVGLVNIVRKEDQVKILKDLGCRYVLNSSSDSFTSELTDALVATGATIAFDALGGGDLQQKILQCMEAAANLTAKEYSRYGSSVHKQLYIYGGLDLRPTVLNRNFGLAWGVGGYLLTPFLAKAGPAVTQRLKDRVAAEMKTNFASSYTREVSLAEALDLEVLKEYAARATGQKTLVNPSKGRPVAKL